MCVYKLINVCFLFLDIHSSSCRFQIRVFSLKKFLFTLNLYIDCNECVLRKINICTHPIVCLLGQVAMPAFMAAYMYVYREKPLWLLLRVLVSQCLGLHTDLVTDVYIVCGNWYLVSPAVRWGKCLLSFCLNMFYRLRCGLMESFRFV